MVVAVDAGVKDDDDGVGGEVGLGPNIGGVGEMEEGGGVGGVGMAGEIGEEGEILKDVCGSWIRLSGLALEEKGPFFI
ncbi:hypothetical protein J5N97_024536 [Dioscorea zingiberensis]|uniref:Uncharacterized protein n=1 Tax=Dioscorea zingiberensis TaxID=325984 RepID=A0A9D5C7M3_9LILI|nr:hypothetical protein J5N97_024536 [Dioscorea zingiberensis]